mmetsp:Transcript_5913/g.8378  ORF Transcript_5913/g.8378 Transcript_5913/m.8378 type:complete len:343 (-) Transcript_5913:87-1115(-)|eukprot:CAMPEP_0197295492 /NCGR_PEP_ID=MMETSP0890-20130614/35670_1 /TAXON_ID=44058 ORGANISM="Aureoumbra lagunensis, Strain CCMP1510" /NCGR_SAMPLE_ID=MMETSP0890 /ASSEMBLY_ACC=CAM_ASM_000533 /LENGTH=342 /DNA_ID=CAMNT_0042771517 /DNA_START=61 /DNA_END=1089 /DNA_ORIENTATION=-
MKAAITGALSYSGRYVAKRVLDDGGQVVNLSRRRRPISSDPLSQHQIKYLAEHRWPMAWDENESTTTKNLALAMEGCDVLICTYWIRFDQKLQGSNDSLLDTAVQRCNVLFNAAKLAGLKKIVFTSHTHASIDSPFDYIAAKARAVELLRESGVNYAVARPCGIFGDTPAESILLNSAAWLMRRVPIFLAPGNGGARFQPIHARDMADLLFTLAQDVNSTAVELDACGPDAPTAMELFSALRDATRSPARIIPASTLGISNRLITGLTAPLNFITGDILLDRHDLDLLCAHLCVAETPNDPRITVRRSLFDWINTNGHHLGLAYVSSMERYYHDDLLSSSNI